jgi:hypothetical protein
MLGISWLKQHDAWIHWSRHRITFNSPHCLLSCRIREPTTVVALAQNPQDTLPEVEPELKPIVVAHKQHPKDTLSEMEPEPQAKPEETPPVEPTTVVPLALPSTLGEERRDKGDGPRMVFPPRNLRKVTHRKVQRKSHKSNTVDQANF